MQKNPDINYHQGSKLYQQKQSYSELNPASLCDLLVVNGWALEEPQRQGWICIHEEQCFLPAVQNAVLGNDGDALHLKEGLLKGVGLLGAWNSSRWTSFSSEEIWF